MELFLGSFFWEDSSKGPSQGVTWVILAKRTTDYSLMTWALIPKFVPALNASRHFQKGTAKFFGLARFWGFWAQPIDPNENKRARV